MTAKLLQLVNSAFFGIQQHVADPQRAASILGLNTITALVLSVKVFSQYDARLMRSLASLGQPTTIDEPYLATIGQAAGRNRMLTAFTSDIRTTDPEEGSRRVSTTLRHLAREFTDVSPLSGRPPDAAC